MSVVRLSASSYTTWDGVPHVGLHVGYGPVSLDVLMTVSEALGLAGALQTAAAGELDFLDGADRDT